jgi:hypothetical protein
MGNPVGQKYDFPAELAHALLKNHNRAVAEVWNASSFNGVFYGS